MNIDWSNLLQWYKELYFDSITWLVNFADWWVRSWADTLVSAFLYVLNAIPCCFDPLVKFVQAIPAILNDPRLAYFMFHLQIGYGIQVIICAYLFRFILRRIPGIG